jgi:hypothetical protein
MIIKYQITQDTDEGRLNNYPCIIVSSTGQKFLFYEKFLTTGKQSFSRITFIPSSFIINVEAGYGSINGINVTWNSGTLIASPNSYQLVYVTSSGILGIKTAPTIEEIKDIIILAYISSGASSITRIEEVEQTGYYIFLRKQVYTGTEWVWENYEYRLNTGKQPRAYYDSNTNKIYLSYLKDSASYLRIFDFSNELTWEYLQNITINSNIITLNKDPQNIFYFSGGSSGFKSKCDIFDDLYPMTTFDFAFLGEDIYIFIPFLTGNYLKYIKSFLTYEVGYFQGENFIIEDSVTVPYTQHSFSYRLWEYSLGLKYIRVRLYTQLFTQEYITSPVYYKNTEIYNYPAKINIEDNNYNINVKDKMFLFGMSAGYNSNIIKTIEYQETKNFQNDYSDNFNFSAGYSSNFVKTIEYQETKNFQNDYSDNFNFSTGYKASLVFSN